MRWNSTPIFLRNIVFSSIVFILIFAFAACSEYVNDGTSSKAYDAVYTIGDQTDYVPDKETAESLSEIYLHVVFQNQYNEHQNLSTTYNSQTKTWIIIGKKNNGEEFTLDIRENDGSTNLNGSDSHPDLVPDANTAYQIASILLPAWNFNWTDYRPYHVEFNSIQNIWHISGYLPTETSSVDSMQKTKGTILMMQKIDGKILMEGEIETYNQPVETRKNGQ